MTENEDTGLLDEERNIMLLLLVLLKAYSVENDELFSVDSELANDLINEYLEANTSVPEINIANADGRMIIDVVMREPSGQEVEQYEMNKEQEVDEDE